MKDRFTVAQDAQQARRWIVTDNLRKVWVFVGDEDHAKAYCKDRNERHNALVEQTIKRNAR